jgi:hypothetical protein
VCALFTKNKDGIDVQVICHYFIIYKENDIIYYYDQSNKRKTTDINMLIEYHHAEKIKAFVLFYKDKDKICILNKDKLKERICF